MVMNVTQKKINNENEIRDVTLLKHFKRIPMFTLNF
jgi:hypothetical protein